MKIVYILGKFPTIAETFIINEIIALLQNGFDVEIFSLNLPGEGIVHSEVINNHLLERTSYFRYRYILQLKSKIGFIKKLLKLRKYNFRQKCTIAYFAQLAQEKKIKQIHCHFVPEFGEIISRLSEIPFSFTAHCFEETGMSEQVKQQIRQRIEYAAFVATATDFARKGLAAMVEPKDKDKIQTVRCGINIGKFVAKRNNSELFTIISVAGLYPRKGTRYLIAALEQIKERIDFKTRIIGDGPLRNELEELVLQKGLENIVEFLGKASNDKVANDLNNSNCFVLPCIVTEEGYMDGLPVAIMEAMAMGLPVISTPVAGIPELIIHGQTGLLVPQRDPKALAEAILQLYKNPDLGKELGIQARQKVEKEFNRKNSGEQLASLFLGGPNHV